MDDPSDIEVIIIDMQKPGELEQVKNSRWRGVIL